MAPSVTSSAIRGSSLDSTVSDIGVAGREVLVDAVIEAAPLLLRGRELLPSLNWQKVTRPQVQRLVERLAEAQLECPAWLARDILLAGHALPQHVAAHLDQELSILCRLNGLSRDDVTSDIVTELAGSIQAIQPSGECVVAIVRRLTELGAAEQACGVALSCWPLTPRAISQVRQSFAEQLKTLPGLKVRVSGLSTTGPFAAALVPAFAKRGLRVEADEAPFGSAIAELHAAKGVDQGLSILLDTRSLFDADWRSGTEGVGANYGARVDALEQAIARYLNDTGKALFINTLPAAVNPSLGYMDVYNAAGLAAVTRRTNAALSNLASRYSNLTLIDTDVALKRISPDARQDARMWFYGRIAFSEAATNAIADAFAVAWTAHKAKPVKVIALDFDNTLWGGVYGDDGIEKLQCGDDAPGNAFKALQQECLRLKAQGKLLVALSKNNSDAISAFDNHPGMALRPDDFAATAINWKPKPDNIRQIAADLNLGLDSILFLDDSAHEREAMRRLCPEVRVPEMPADPAARPGWLRGLSETWPARLTTEDIERPAMYLAERKAREFKDSSANYDDYLHGLSQRLVIEALSQRTLARVAQLHERTNQFNPTTRRFSEADLSKFMTQPESAMVLLGTAEDRFGAHGIVIAGVARIEGETAYLDSLVMSCRVIARQIEAAFIGTVLDELTNKGVRSVVATFRSSGRNELVRDLYPSLGFEALESDDNETQTWIWKASQQALPASDHVAVEWRT